MKIKLKKKSIFGFMTLKYLCVIEIESNPGHYNNGIINKPTARIISC